MDSLQLLYMDIALFIIVLCNLRFFVCISKNKSKLSGEYNLAKSIRNNDLQEC